MWKSFAALTALSSISILSDKFRCTDPNVLGSFSNLLCFREHLLSSSVQGQILNHQPDIGLPVDIIALVYLSQGPGSRSCRMLSWFHARAYMRPCSELEWRNLKETRSILRRRCVAWKLVLCV